MAVADAVPGLLSLTRRGIQRAQALVAVGLEGTHAQRLGQSESLAVVCSSLLGFWWVTASTISPRRTMVMWPSPLRLYRLCGNSGQSSQT